MLYVEIYEFLLEYFYLRLVERLEYLVLLYKREIGRCVLYSI